MICKPFIMICKTSNQEEKVPCALHKHLASITLHVTRYTVNSQQNQPSPEDSLYFYGTDEYLIGS